MEVLIICSLTIIQYLQIIQTKIQIIIQQIYLKTMTITVVTTTITPTIAAITTITTIIVMEIMIVIIIIITITIITIIVIIIVIITIVIIAAVTVTSTSFLIYFRQRFALNIKVFFFIMLDIWSMDTVDSFLDHCQNLLA